MCKSFLCKTLTGIFSLNVSVLVDAVGERLPVQFWWERFLCLCSTVKHQLNLKLPVVCLLVKPLCSLSYGNITSLERDHDIVGYQVSDLISQDIRAVELASNWLIANLGFVNLPNSTVSELLFENQIARNSNYVGNLNYFYFQFHFSNS